VAFYSDKTSIFRVNRKEHAGSGLTQFGRAMSELNIDVICANSAPAKGRAERAHQTLQDRLVKELRLAGVSTMEDGNAFLAGLVSRNLTLNYNRVLYVLEPTAEARAVKGKRVRVYEDDDGHVSLRAADLELSARDEARLRGDRSGRQRRLAAKRLEDVEARG
jgi:hypothetical protein